MTSQQVDAFQVIADPSRRLILEMLAEKSMRINELALNFDMSRPAVSKHIKVLDQAGFISIQDIGRERHCVLRQEGFHAVQNWLHFFDKFWAQKLTNLDLLIKKDHGK